VLSTQFPDAEGEVERTKHRLAAQTISLNDGRLRPNRRRPAGLMNAITPRILGAASRLRANVPAPPRGACVVEAAAGDEADPPAVFLPKPYRTRDILNNIRRLAV
jgi:hypothetical protein